MDHEKTSFLERAGLIESIDSEKPEQEDSSFLERAGLVESVESEQDGPNRKENRSAKKILSDIIWITVVLILILGISGFINMNKISGIYECLDFGLEELLAEDTDNPFSGLTSLFMNQMLKEINLNLDKDLSGSMSAFGEVLQIKWIPPTLVTPGRMTFIFDDESATKTDYNYSGGILSFSISSQSQPEDELNCTFRKVG